MGRGRPAGSSNNGHKLKINAYQTWCIVKNEICLDIGLTGREGARAGFGGGGGGSRGGREP
jgi:hypothetical protein